MKTNEYGLVMFSTNVNVAGHIQRGAFLLFPSMYFSALLFISFPFRSDASYNLFGLSDFTTARYMVISCVSAARCYCHKSVYCIIFVW